MNCKPGDLAVVLRSGVLIHAGAIVTCIAQHGDGLSHFTGRVMRNVWSVEWNGARGPFDGGLYGVADEDLQPIRPPRSEPPLRVCRPVDEVAA